MAIVDPNMPHSECNVQPRSISTPHPGHGRLDNQERARPKLSFANGSFPIPSIAASMVSPQGGTVHNSMLISPRGTNIMSMTEQDIAVAVSEHLQKAPAGLRSQECERRRHEVQRALTHLSKVLDESEEALKLRPSKRDRLTAGNYHTCFRHLHWSLDRCKQLQEVLKALESYDSALLEDASASLEYALIGVDVVTHHARALQLLDALCSCETTKPEAESSKSSTSWFRSTLSSFGVCSGRVCMRTPSNPDLTDRKGSGSHRACLRDSLCMDLPFRSTQNTSAWSETATNKPRPMVMGEFILPTNEHV